jgi:hypothetical protein
MDERSPESCARRLGITTLGQTGVLSLVMKVFAPVFPSFKLHLID